MSGMILTSKCLDARTWKAAFLVAIAPMLAHAAEPKGAEPATRAANAAVLDQLPFNDRSTFDDARRGFVAAPPDLVIRTDGDRVAWTMSAFDFLNKDQAPATVNPSLWRQAQLNAIYGLFKVADRVYQVRGYDLANMTIIEGDTGLIIVDPLFVPETARAALDLYFQHRPRKPISTAIYTHSHIDHFGGVKGIVSEEDVRAGKVKIIAPDKFMDHAVAENVLAGNAMSRRVQYQFGTDIPRNETGYIDGGLGKALPRGLITLIPPTDLIIQPVETRTIDGVEIVFLLTPGTEAPSEMVMHYPQFRVLNMAEVATQNLHNLYTIRGAEVRDANAWAKYINQALELFGDKSDVVIAQHHWPTWGQDRVVTYLKKQRDLYKYLHDQSVRLLNHGYTGPEISEMLKLPSTLSGEWYARDYYGTVSHNVKAVYQKYLGWYSANPADLNPLPPAPAGKKLVEYMGGADAVMRRAREDFKKGEFRWVAQVMSQVVYAEPDNREARELAADALEQLGYQSEAGTWRSAYLQGALELRQGVARTAGLQSANPDTIKALTVDMIFDYLGVRLNGPKADGKTIVLNWHFTDTGRNYVSNLENSALTYTPDKVQQAADARILLSRDTLNSILLRQATFDKVREAGQVQIEGDAAKFTELLGLLDDFELNFNIVAPRRQ